MNELADFCPLFERPPVVETRIGVQFSPLVGFRSAHYGLFWEECLGTAKWRLLEDQPASPKEMERFGGKRLRPTLEKQQPEDFPQVCMRLSSLDSGEIIQFQPNKLIYGLSQERGSRPSYSSLKSKFDRLFGQLEVFAGKWNLSKPEVNLWEITYVNRVGPGQLWQTPADWHRVLPGIFPPNGPQVEGHEWSTFNGTWFFVIPPQMGRVRVRVQKAVEIQTDEIVLLWVITSRGEIGALGAPDWSSGLEVGHRSAVRVFFDIASREVREEWGLRQ